MGHVAQHAVAHAVWVLAEIAAFLTGDIWLDSELLRAQERRRTFEFFVGGFHEAVPGAGGVRARRADGIESPALARRDAGGQYQEVRVAEPAPAVRFLQAFELGRKLFLFDESEDLVFHLRLHDAGGISGEFLTTGRGWVWVFHREGLAVMRLVLDAVLREHRVEVLVAAAVVRQIFEEARDAGHVAFRVGGRRARRVPVDHVGRRCRREEQIPRRFFDERLLGGRNLAGGRAEAFVF